MSSAQKLVKYLEEPDKSSPFHQAAMNLRRLHHGEPKPSALALAAPDPYLFTQEETNEDNEERKKIPGIPFGGCMSTGGKAPPRWAPPTKEEEEDESRKVTTATKEHKKHGIRSGGKVEAYRPKKRKRPRIACISTVRSTKPLRISNPQSG